MLPKKEFKFMKLTDSLDVWTSLRWVMSNTFDSPKFLVVEEIFLNIWQFFLIFCIKNVLLHIIMKIYSSYLTQHFLSLVGFYAFHAKIEERNYSSWYTPFLIEQKDRENGHNIFQNLLTCFITKFKFIGNSSNKLSSPDWYLQLLAVPHLLFIFRLKRLNQ